MAEQADWRVELPQFSGPLELLLHLLDQEELSVEGIEVSRVCDRYLAYLSQLERIDIDAAGEFLVMASTLMRLKSQALLPAEERVLEDDDLDPRFELVRQLIEYRKLKRQAGKLDQMREAFLLRFERGMRPELSDEPPRLPPDQVPIDAGGATLEQLFAAFARLLRETETDAGWVIARDDTPMEAHLERLEREFTPGRRLTLRECLGDRRSRAWVIGVFLALLEMIKRGFVTAEQDDAFGDVKIVVRDARLEDAPAPTSQTAARNGSAPDGASDGAPNGARNGTPNDALPPPDARTEP
ncbi:MAG: Segregation and condensation protein A [Planctomycetes bacterium]|nr:Segregation and condensation protein A [Planctomycetota bacterium]